MTEKELDRMIQSIEIGCLIGIIILLLIYLFT